MVWVLSTLKPFTQLRHVIYYSYITSSLYLQVLLMNAENVFCISNIYTSNTNGEWAFWQQHTSRKHCKTLTAASLFQKPGLWLRRLKELKMHPTTYIVIYGYLGLVSYSNSEQALSTVLKHFLLAVNKQMAIDQTTHILVMQKQHANTPWGDSSDQMAVAHFSLLQEDNCPS